MSRTLYEPSGIVISASLAKIKFVVRFIHIRYHVISLKNRQTELVISVIQIYGGKVVRREDDALLAQHKHQRHDGKSVRLILSFHSTSSSFLNSRASTVCRNRRYIYPQKF